MPFNKVNTVLTAAQVTALKAAIVAMTAPANLPVKFNLTKKERTDLENIDNKRYPYVQRTITTHAVAHPTLVSGIAGTLVEATNDWTYGNQLEDLALQLEGVVEILRDTQQVAYSELYAWFREFYRMAQAGAENQVPGADAIVADLSPLFENQGPQPPPVV